MNLFIEIFCIIFHFTIVAIDARVGPHIVTGTIYRPKTDYQVPFKAWYDPKHHRSRIDYFGSDVKTYQLQIGGTHTMLYKINRASDISGKWIVCHMHRKDGIFYQPAIPVLMSRDHSESAILYGTPCTKYWVQTGSALFHYYVREEDSIEIPLLYVKYVNPWSYSISDYIYYDQYTPASFIYDEVFLIDPKIGDDCRDRPTEKSLNPMSQFLSPIDKNILDIHGKKFSSHANRYEKQYSNTHTEAKFREKIFLRNLELIDAFNREQHSYRLGINQFTDRTDEELVALQCLDEQSLNLDYQFNSSAIMSNVELPAEFDYRKHGFETRVKDQQGCGCCYVFGAVAAVEGAYFKKTGNSVNLSEQSLLECASWRKHRAGGGCFGGLGEWVLEHVQKLGGIPAEHDYRQYAAMEPECQWKNDALVVQIKEVVHVPRYDIIELKKALIKFGPVKISVQVSKQFYQYTDGVFDDPQCTNKTLSHALMLVGYGEEWGKPYWLVKNSWGSDWGDDGYIKISQENNRCGVLNNPFYVVLN